MLLLGGVLLATAALATAAVMALNPPPAPQNTLVQPPGSVRTSTVQPGAGGDLGLPAQPTMTTTSGTPSTPGRDGSGTPVFIPGTSGKGTSATWNRPGETPGPSAAKGSVSTSAVPVLATRPPEAAGTPGTPRAGSAKPGVPTPGAATQPAMRDPFAAQSGLGNGPAQAAAAAPTQAAAPMTLRPPRPATGYEAPLPMPRVVSVPSPVQIMQTPAPVVQMPGTPSPVQMSQAPNAPQMSAVPLPQLPSPAGMPQAVLVPAPKPVRVNQAQSAVRRIGLSLSGTHKVGNADVALLTTSAGGYREVTAGAALPELNATVTAVTADSLILKVGKDTIKLTLGEPQK